MRYGGEAVSHGSRATRVEPPSSPPTSSSSTAAKSTAAHLEQEEDPRQYYYYYYYHYHPTTTASSPGGVIGNNNISTNSGLYDSHTDLLLEQRECPEQYHHRYLQYHQCPTNTNGNTSNNNNCNGNTTAPLIKVNHGSNSNRSLLSKQPFFHYQARSTTVHQHHGSGGGGRAGFTSVFTSHPCGRGLLRGRRALVVSSMGWVVMLCSFLWIFLYTLTFSCCVGNSRIQHVGGRDDVASAASAALEEEENDKGAPVVAALNVQAVAPGENQHGFLPSSTRQIIMGYQQQQRGSRHHNRKRDMLLQGGGVEQEAGKGPSGSSSPSALQNLYNGRRRVVKVYTEREDDDMIYTLPDDQNDNDDNNNNDDNDLHDDPAQESSHHRQSLPGHHYDGGVGSHHGGYLEADVDDRRSRTFHFRRQDGGVSGSSSSAKHRRQHHQDANPHTGDNYINNHEEDNYNNDNNHENPSSLQSDISHHQSSQNLQQNTNFNSGNGKTRLKYDNGKPPRRRGGVGGERERVGRRSRKERDREEWGKQGYTRKLPHGLIIGVKKGGTRALLEFLRVHPDIRAPGPEPHFFDRNYEKGLDWYRSQMPPTLDSQLTLEKTPSYFVTKGVPGRIFNMSRSIKLIVVVRDPVTRAISDYTQSSSKRTDVKAFEQMAFLDNSTGLVDTSWGAIRIGVYAKHLERWLKYFPLTQIHFVSGERLISDPAAELAKVQDFLGLKRVITDKHFYFNSTKGFPCLKKPEGSGNPHCLGKTKGRPHPKVDPKVINRLHDFYRPFNQKFYQMTNIDFNWH